MCNKIQNIWETWEKFFQRIFQRISMEIWSEMSEKFMNEYPYALSKITYFIGKNLARCGYGVFFAERRLCVNEICRMLLIFLISLSIFQFYSVLRCYLESLSQIQELSRSIYRFLTQIIPLKSPYHKSVAPWFIREREKKKKCYWAHIICLRSQNFAIGSYLFSFIELKIIFYLFFFGRGVGG